MRPIAATIAVLAILSGSACQEYVLSSSNDPGRPDAEATQSGAAHLTDGVVDEYEQLEGNATDILWIVDNSGSMMVEQNALALNFASFIGIVEAAGVDYHIAVSCLGRGFPCPVPSLYL